MVETVKAVRERLREKSLDGLLLYNHEGSNRSSVTYVSGFTGSLAVVIVTMDENLLITDSRYYTQALEETDFELVKLDSSSKIEEITATVLKQKNLKRVAFESDKITHSRFLGLSEAAGDIEFVDSDSLVGDLRAVKSDKEIEKIREAVRIAEESLKEALNVIRAGRREIEVAAALEYEIRRRGGKIAFDTIVVSGERSALVHGTPSDRPIGDGEFVLIDFGVRFQGYCSDITRTFCVGRPDHRMRSVYETVYNAQKTARERARAGITGKALHFVAQDIIAEAGFGEYFGHGLGHGLGMDVHESPRASPNNDRPLEEGNVITVEPGIYIPKEFGIRIEDDVVIKTEGIAVLTTFERDLMLL